MSLLTGRTKNKFAKKPRAIFQDRDMAPVNIDTVDGQFPGPTHKADLKRDYFADDMSPERLRDVIQDLFEIQEALHRYLGPETQEKLKYQMYSFTITLSRLARLMLTCDQNHHSKFSRSPIVRILVSACTHSSRDCRVR